MHGGLAVRNSRARVIEISLSLLRPLPPGRKKLKEGEETAVLLACFMRFIYWKALRSFTTEEEVELLSLSVFLACREYTEGFNVITA